MKIICVLLLLGFLNPGIVFASNKIKIALTVASFNPISSLIRGGSVYGVIFEHDISTKYAISIAFNSLESKPNGQSDIQLMRGVQLKATIFSLRALYKFPLSQNHEFYVVAGPLVYKIREIRSSVALPESDTSQDCPLGMEFGFGIQISKSRFFLRGGIERIALNRAQSLMNPVAWKANKFILSFGIKL